MYFHIYTTSTWDVPEQIRDECVEKEVERDRNDEPVFQYFIEINSLEELQNLQERVGGYSLIVNFENPNTTYPEIEVYDSWRE